MDIEWQNEWSCHLRAWHGVEDLLAFRHDIRSRMPDTQVLLVLDLGDNSLASVPESVGQLEELRELYLGNNRLTGVPKTISGLSNLTTVDLDGNPIP